MGLRYPNQKNHSCFFVTSSFSSRIKFGLVEGIYEMLIDSLLFYKEKFGAKIAAYTLMPSHIHLLLFIEGAQLPHSMRDYKKYAAQEGIRKVIIKIPHLWMPRYDRVAILDESIFRIKLDYIHNNSVTAGLVAKPEDWPWSSAEAYMKGVDRYGLVWKDW